MYYFPSLNVQSLGYTYVNWEQFNFNLPMTKSLSKDLFNKIINVMNLYKTIFYNFETNTPVLIVFFQLLKSMLNEKYLFWNYLKKVIGFIDTYIFLLLIYPTCNSGILLTRILSMSLTPQKNGNIRLKDTLIYEKKIHSIIQFNTTDKRVCKLWNVKKCCY